MYLAYDTIAKIIKMYLAYDTIANFISRENLQYLKAKIFQEWEI